MVVQLIKYLFLFLLTTGVACLHAQEFGSNAINAPMEKNYDHEAQPTMVEKKQGFKPDVSVSLGSSFSSWAPGYNSFGTWVMPEFTFPVNKKFAIRAGIGYSNTFYSTPGNEGTIFSQNNAQFGHVYVSGMYRVNDKLTITGTAYKSFEIAPPQNQVNPRAIDFSNEGIMMNLDYKVSENMRINATFSYQKYHPYGNFMNPGGGFYGQPSPFGGQTSPFYNSGFGPGF
jgi:hypothetical protein